MEEYYKCIEEFKDNGKIDIKYGELGKIYKGRAHGSHLSVVINNNYQSVSFDRFKKVDTYIKPIDSNYKLKVGDPVKISNTSEFYNRSAYNPINTKGIITENSNIAGDFKYRVSWSNCENNVYREKDLVLFDENNKEEESLLDKAKRLYPIGTKVKSAYGNGIIQTIKSDPRRPIGSIFVNSGQETCCIYDKDNGKWAEIISKPNEDIELSLLEQAKIKYPIGTKFASAVSKLHFTVKSHEIEVSTDKGIIIFETNEPNGNGKHYACVHHNDKWAEIINELELNIESSPVVPNVNTNSNFINPNLHVFDKKENLIEPVHSINVKLRTKKNKFKY